jgi:hypothetical protein
MTLLSSEACVVEFQKTMLPICRLHCLMLQEKVPSHLQRVERSIKTFARGALDVTADSPIPFAIASHPRVL